MTVAAEAPAFLSGGGEVGALMRALDWSRSPLGDPADWPQSLRSIVGLMLGSKFPMFVAWGPELGFLYNDSYVEILGGKHPTALGARFQDIWAEIWSDISPLIDAALAGRASYNQDLPLLMNRRGYDERTWFTFSYSPVRNDEGEIAGMFCACQETTDRLLAERRAAAEGRRFAELFDQAPAFMAVLRGPDHRFELVNPPYQRLIGDRDVVGRTVAEALPDAAAQGYTDLLDGVYRTGRPYTASGARLTFHDAPGQPADERFLDFVYQPITDLSGAVSGILVQGVDVTATHRAQDALRESEDHYRHAVELDPQTTWTSAPDGQLDHVNRRWFEWTGTTGLGSSYADGLHADDRQRTFDAWGRSVATGEPYDIEHRVKMRDGSYRWMHSRAYPRRDEAGRIVKWYGTTEDIHDRRLAEDERDRTARLLASFIEAVPGVVYAKDRDGRMLVANRGAADLVGKPLDRIIGRTDAEFLDDRGDAAAVMANDRRIMESGRGEQVEEEIRLPDGSPAVWLSTKEPLRDEAGRTVGLVGSSVDVTARRRAEDALREETRTLETLNRVGAALAGELDAERLVQMVTDASVELTGAKFGAFFHNILDETGERLHLYTLSGAERSDFDRFGAVRATGVFGPTFRNEGVVRSDDILADSRYGHFEPHRGMPPGHLPVRSYMGVPVVSRDGAVLGGLLFGHPEPGRFTERHERLMLGVAAQAAVAIDNARLFAEVQAANETLERRVVERTLELEEAHEALRQSQKMEAVGQLTGGIAHDFNNMLAVVVGSLDLLGRRLPGDDPRARRYLDAAADGARRAAQLTQRLLAFSRQQPLRPEPLDANKLVAGMADLLRHSIGPDIRLDVELDPALWRTHADPNQLENAILNLAVNARDAMPDGGRLAVATRNIAGEGGEQVLIAVSDTGLGMTPEVIAKAFDPFFTTKEVGKGTGLGLSQVYGFVNQSGGRIAIRSAPGEGTTVEITLPRYMGAGEEDAAAAGDAPLATADAREVVLVVEDEAAVRQFSTDALSELGYRVLEADGAAAALRCLDAHPEVALLFTDVVMPEVNGARLAEEARCRRPDLRVLFTTGYARDAIAEGGVLEPGVELIGKPFTVEELAAKVRHVLDATSA